LTAARVLLAAAVLGFAATAPVHAADPQEGVASWWHGDVAATPDCTWPWIDCPTLAITSHLTGLRIVVTPQMFCGCHVGTSDERLLDLTRSQVRALGLDLADGIYDVTVERVSAAAGLPDTAVASR
jgi:hypothetical protein